MSRAPKMSAVPAMSALERCYWGISAPISEIAKTDAIDPCGHLTGEWSAVNRSVAS